MLYFDKDLSGGKVISAVWETLYQETKFLSINLICFFDRRIGVMVNLEWKNYHPPTGAIQYDKSGVRNDVSRALSLDL